MALRSDIGREHNWFWGERKTLTIAITDVNNAPVNLTNTNISWRIRREQGSPTVYLVKTSGLSISGNNSNIVTITIDPDTDYNSMPYGIHFHQLRDDDNDAELSHGDAWVQRSAGGV